MPNRLSASQISHFHEEGFLPGIEVFTAQESDDFRAKAEDFEARHPEDVPWAFDIKCNLLFDWVYEFSTHPPLLDIIEDLIGPDILLSNSIFRVKEPGSKTYYGWHQDAARIQVVPNFAIAYLAIGDATAENGCLRVIPRSHLKIEPYHLVEYSERQLARVTDVDESSAVDLDLEKGQVGIFNCNTIHGSGANRSDSRRFALVNDYTPAESRQSVAMGSGQLVRGSNRYGSWGVEPAPGRELEINAQARRDILYKYPENVLMGPLEPGQQPSFADRVSA